MFLIPMLHQLAQLTERPRALTTTIGEVWNASIRSVIRQEGSLIHEPLHITFTPGKIVDLAASIVLPATSRAIPAFHVLDGVCARSET
jgi:hypothetical protein